MHREANREEGWRRNGRKKRAAAAETETKGEPTNERETDKGAGRAHGTGGTRRGRKLIKKKENGKQMMGARRIRVESATA